MTVGGHRQRVQSADLVGGVGGAEHESRGGAWRSTAQRVWGAAAAS